MKNTTNKTVTVNGEKVKVSYSKVRTENTTIESNEYNRDKGFYGVITEGLIKYDFVLNGETFNIELKTFLKNTKKGLKHNQEYIFNSISFGDNEKKVIEHILNN